MPNHSHHRRKFSRCLSRIRAQPPLPSTRRPTRLLRTQSTPTICMTAMVAMGVISKPNSTAPRWMTMNISPGRSSAISRPIVALPWRRVIWTHTRHPIATSTRMAKAYARLTKRRRERARRHQRWIAWSACSTASLGMVS
jgi:hypothetical protein